VGAFSIGVLVEWVLATPVNFWVGRKIHIGAVKSLSHRAFTMDVLLRFLPKIDKKKRTFVFSKERKPQFGMQRGLFLQCDCCCCFDVRRAVSRDDHV
jgi:hypothetical protein